MIPYLLAIAGGYLIAQSRKQDTFANGGTMDEGGLMKDFDKNFTTAYILQQQMADKQKVQGVAHDSYDTTYYNEKYYPIRYHDGHSFASKELYNDLRDGSGNLKGSDEREVEEKITAYFDESDVKKLSGSTLHDMWKNGEGISVEKKKKKWFFDDGGMTDDDIEINEGDIFEADYEKEYENYYKVIKIERINKDADVTFENVNPTKDTITKKLSELNDEVKEGKYQVLTKVKKNTGLYSNYLPKQNNIIREGNYLKEVVTKQPNYKLTFYDEGRDEWALRDVYDLSLDRERTATIKKMIKSGSLQKQIKKIFYSKGGTIEEALERFDVTKLDAFEKMQYDNFSKSAGKQQALQVLINSVEGDYSELSPHLRAIAEKFKMAKGGKFEYKSTEVKSRVQVGGFYIYSDYNDNPYETNPDRKFIAYIPAFAEDGYFPYSAYPTRAEAVENAREYYQGDFDAGKFEPTEDYVKRLKKKQNK